MTGWWTLFRKRLRDHAAILILGGLLVVIVCFIFVYLNSRIRTVEQLRDIWGIPVRMYEQVTGGRVPEEFERMTVPRSVATAYISPMMMMSLVAFPIAVAARGLAGEVGSGTADLILAQPVRRGAVYLANATVIAVGALVFAGLSYGMLVVGSRVWATFEPLPAGRFAAVAANAACLCLAVGGMSLLCSAAFSEYGRALLLPIVVVLVMGLIELLGKMWSPAAGVRPWGLFFYYDPMLISDGGVPRAMSEAVPATVWPVVASGTLAGIGLICMIVGYMVYRRRDIATI